MVEHFWFLHAACYLQNLRLKYEFSPCSISGTGIWSKRNWSSKQSGPGFELRLLRPQTL